MNPGADPGDGSAVLAGVAGSERYAVKLPVFEGPLDLLLHLIRINEVEVTDIPIALVGEQYLEYLGLMRELNLDVAGEYLLMAATLAWIKSRFLLPPDGVSDPDEGLDPRAELIARLLEYQRFKEAAGELAERPWLTREVFQARGPEPERPPDAAREIEVGLFDLIEAYRAALRAQGPSGQPHEVEVERVTVRDRMIAVMDQLEQHDGMRFDQIIVDAEGNLISRPVFVATFLAILELSRLDALHLYQSIDELGAPEGPIHLRLAPDGDPRSWSERITELM
jgi:segregation and condensation protein A